MRTAALRAGSASTILPAGLETGMEIPEKEMPHG